MEITGETSKFTETHVIKCQMITHITIFNNNNYTKMVLHITTNKCGGKGNTAIIIAKCEKTFCNFQLIFQKNK